MAQGLDVAQETEGAGPADLLDERGCGQIDGRRPGAGGEGRVIEIDGKLHLEAIIGLEHGVLVTVLHPDPAFDADKALGALLLLDARRLDQEDEGAGTAIHDGHLRRADVHIGIVDTQAGEGREQMLHGGDAHTVLDQGGGEAGIAHIQRTGGDIHRHGEVGAAKNDAGVRGRGAQGQVDLVTGVQADARGADDIFERTLPDHRPSPLGARC